MKLKLFIVFTILFSIANAHSYSNNEGILSPNHSQEMKALRTKYFSSAQAIEEGITKITKLREEIKGTLYSFQYNRYISIGQIRH